MKASKSISIMVFIPVSDKILFWNEETFPGLVVVVVDVVVVVVTVVAFEEMKVLNFVVAEN